MLQTIIIGDEERPLNFGPNMLIEFEKEENINFLDQEGMNKNLSFSKLGTFAYLALKHGARVERQAFKYTKSQVLDWFPNMVDLMQVMELFGESMPKEGEKKGNQAEQPSL